MKRQILKNRIFASVMLFFVVMEVLRVPLVMAVTFVPSIPSPASTLQVEEPKPSFPINHIGVIAVLVEDGVMNNNTLYDGLRAKVFGSGQTFGQLFPGVLNENTLADRVRRYALYIQRVRAYSRSVIIKVKKDEKTENIVNSLERLYNEGDSQRSGEVSKLTGIVIVGDVPLPVVNKNGNRFVSMLPYTDFREKAYIFDKMNGDFVPNPDSTSTQPEVWHGVIVPPVKGEDGNKLLAEYFDKNYLFHCDVGSCIVASVWYRSFTKKLLFADLYNEFKQVNKVAFSNYLRYLEYWEDIAYQRWSKLLAYKFVKATLDQTASGVSDVPQPNDYDPDMDGTPKNDPAGEIKGKFVDGKEEPDGCPGVCGVDEDLDSIDSDQDGYPNGYEKEIGSWNGAANVLPDPNVDPPAWENPDDKPLDAGENLRTDPAPNAAWWMDEGSRYDDRPYNFTKNGTNCSAPNTDIANCAGNSYDDDEDGTVDEEADAANHPNDNQNHFTPAADQKTFDLMPDIMTRKIIEQVTSDYNSLFSTFKANINDWAGFTGRYNPSYTDSLGKSKSDVSTIPGLVTMKDELTRKYMRSVNDAVENAIDARIKYNPYGPYLEKRLMVLKGAKITSVLHMAFGDITGDPVEFINSGSNPELLINGKNASQVKNVNDCYMYRGSEGPAGVNSTMVLAYHLLNVFVNEDQETKNKYGGCIGENGLHPEYCFTDTATLPVFDIMGTKKVTAIPADETNYRACFDLKEKAGFTDYMAQVAAFVAKLQEPAYKGNEKAREALARPRSPYTPASQIPLFQKTVSFPNPPPTPTAIDPSPAQTYTNVNFYISLYDIAKIFGAIDEVDNNTDGTKDEFAELSPLYAIGDTDYKQIGARILQDAKIYTVPNLPGNPQNLFEMMLPGAEATLNSVNTTTPTFHQKINDFEITVTPEWAKQSDGSLVYIDSFDPHKEPTDETLKAQSKPGTAPIALPIDNPRYFTFQDQNGKVRKVEYPNLFKARDYNDLLSILQAKEAELQQIADESGVAITFAGTLTALVSGMQDIYTSTERTTIYQANKGKMKDAYDWHNLNIDEKHQYAIDVYLDPRRDPYVGKTPAGYEAMYILAKGGGDKMYMNFNGDIPEKDSDPRLEQINTQEEPAGTEPPAAGGSGGSGSGGAGGGAGAGGAAGGTGGATTPSGSSGAGGGTGAGASPTAGTEPAIGDDGAVSWFEWFPAILKWVQEISDLKDATKSAPVCGASKQLSDMAAADSGNEGGAAETSGGATTGSAEVGGGTGGAVGASGTDSSISGASAVSTPTGKPNFNRNTFFDPKADLEAAKKTVKFRITSDKTVLETGSADAANITVESLGANGEVITADSFTKVKLNLSAPSVVTASKVAVQTTDDRTMWGGAEELTTSSTSTTSTASTNDIITVSPQDAASLADGSAAFKALPTDKNGKVTITASSPDSPGITSNSITIESSKKKIRILSYRNVNKPQYSKSDLTGFVIKDVAGKVIANVDAKTGMVEITDRRFDLTAMPSSKDKPARLGVREISTKEIIASVYFVSDVKQNVTVDDQKADYFASYAEMKGTRVKDIDTKDENNAVSVSAGQQFNAGGVYLMKTDTVQNVQVKIGIIDREGNIFLTADYGLRLKDNSTAHGPVVFDVTDKNGKAIFEVYVGAEFPKIEIIKESGKYQEFNKIASLIGKKILAGIGRVSKKNFPSVMKRALISIAHAATVVPDTDKDGLNDLEEVIIGTIYNNSDTDGDTYSDNGEILTNFNPLKKSELLFSDLTTASKGFADIIRLFKRGVITGYEDGTFKPDKKLSREEFVKLDLGSVCINCTRFNGEIKKSIDSEYYKSPFPDSDITPELQYCVRKAKNEEIVSGYAGGEKKGFFLPGNAISRAEATKVVVETVNTQGGNIFPLGPENSGKPWYYNYILAAQRAKLYPKGYFIELDTYTPEKFKNWFDTNPPLFTSWITGEISRTEFAVMVSRLIDNYDCFKQDQDSDGIPDNLEKYVFGTKPDKEDSDGGGVKDLDEIKKGTNPLNPQDDRSMLDPDGDGLTNDEEAKYGTKPDIRDTDDGGVNDGDEIKDGTDPLNPKDDDSDKDGMPNWWEKKYGLNPNDPSDAKKDKDGDGLVNLEEYKHGTDPTKPDTDGGGVNDGDEVLMMGTDPLNPSDDKYTDTKKVDTDGGGVYDDEEIKYGTRPLDPKDDDSDRDGMPNWWEKKYGLDPYDPSDANKDKDGDGLTNLEEYKHSTDPTKPDTDGGGVNDGTEVKGGTGAEGTTEVKGATDPLNPLDDYSKDAEAWKKKYGIDPNDSAVANLDPDGDGLTNKDEAKYGTDPNKPDTDEGGVKDGDEVKNGTNPLNPKDDDSDKDGMPDYFEKQYGLDTNDPTDADKDKDGDGLSNLDEFKHSTDPTKPDTDDGGVNDGTEVKNGTDPLNPLDDKGTLPAPVAATANKPGGFIVGNTVEENYSYSLVTPTGPGSTEKEFTDEMPADDQSSLYVVATLIGEDGEIDTGDSVSTLTFFDSERGGTDTAIIPGTITVKNGVAETTIKAGKVAGIYTVSAKVVNGSTNLPVDIRPIFILPLEPANLIIKPESSVIRSGGLTTSAVHVELRDINGNLCNNGIYQTSFKLDGPGELDMSADVDKNKDGLQLSTMEGTFDLKLKSKQSPGTIKITGEYDPAPPDELDQSPQEDESSSSPVQNAVNAVADMAESLAKQALSTIKKDTSIENRDDLSVSLAPVTASLPGDYTSTTKIKLAVVDRNKNVVTGFNGKANFTLADEIYGKFTDPKVQEIKNGQAEISFAVANIAGNAIINATIPGFETATTTVAIQPKAAKKLALESDSDVLEANPYLTMEIRARLYDNDDNFAANDSTTPITFELTNDSKKYAAFVAGPTTVTAINGIASVKIRGLNLTGPVNIIASSGSLNKSVLKLSTIKTLMGKDMRDISPHVLYSSILGGDFGNIFKQDYLAGWFVFSGEAQAATSLVSTPKPKAHLVEFSPTGQMTLIDEGNLSVNITPNNGGIRPNRVLIRSLLDNSQIAELMVAMPTGSKAIVANESNPVKETVAGTYVQKTDTSTDYELKPFRGGITVMKKENEALRVLDDGGIKILNASFKVATDTSPDNKFLTFNISDAGSDIAKISYVTNFTTDVKVLGKYDWGWTRLQPGVHIKVLSKQKNIGYETSYAGNSTALPRGIFIIDKDTDLPANKAPGQNYPSLEKAEDVAGVGFHGENKHMLLFSAGNTVGESNLPYASEIGIVLGDPTIRKDNATTLTAADYAKEMVFTKDIGQEIYMGSDPVQELVPIDYNSDGLKDILVAYKNGQVRLLQNNKAYPRFEDRGVFLNFPNGILSLATADFNRDGQEDLVLASADSCRAGEVCIDEYENHGGNFVRKHLNLRSFSEKNRVYMIRASDMNRDGYAEIITSDDMGNIRVFWNDKGAIRQTGQYVGNLGVHIDNTANQKGEVLVYYEGVPNSPVNQPGSLDDANFKTLTFDIKQEPGAATDAVEAATLAALKTMGDSLGSETPAQPAASAQKSYDYIYLDMDLNLGVSSEKRARDMTQPLNAIAIGDRVEYSIKLFNSGARNISNLSINDSIPESVTFDKESVTCTGCGNKPGLLETGQSLRPYVFTGIDVPSNSSITITYLVTVKKTPKVKISIGNNFDSGYKNDGYNDISASPEGNPTGRMVYYYSDTIRVLPTITVVDYSTYTSPPPQPQPATDPKDPTGQKKIIPSAQEMTDSLKVDADGNGLPDMVEKMQNDLNQENTSKDDTGGDALDSIADDLEAGLAKYTCSGGCLPLPINMAFLAPGAINAMGVPGGLDPGFPVFAAGIPSLIPIWPPSPYQASVFRLYLSPTLTGSLGIGTCVGPYLAGLCFAFAAGLIPSGVCDAISGAPNKILSGAKDSAQSASGAAGVSSDGSAGAADASGRQATGGFTSSPSLGNYHMKASTQTNFRIPGFPSVITEWLDKQTEEIITKLTDGPDLFVFLPDTTSMMGAVMPQEGAPNPNPKAGELTEKLKAKAQKTSITNPKDLLEFLNAMPLIQIETKDVLFKIPALTTKEIVKLQRDAQQWMEDERTEVNRVLALWCGTPYQLDTDYPATDTSQGWKLKKMPADFRPPNATACERLLVDMTKAVKSIEKNIQVLEKYKELPRKILAWRDIQRKYLSQIICYFDAVVKFVGGYIVQQQKRIEGWIDAVRKLMQQIKDFKIMFDLMIDFTTSCDKCSTARFSLFEMLLKLFLVIPSPPIIPFPKWPDIYFDLSNIQAGLKIIWPDLRFRPEPLIIPKIPRILLPDLPTLSISLILPELPIIPDPPNLPELPDLPPLPLPSLPNLPPPPKLPQIFPASIKAAINILKQVLKILCLLKKGLIPVAETGLKSQIEQLTERSSNLLLPFDLGLNLQAPNVGFNAGIPSRIEVSGHLNLQLKMDFIYDFVKDFADKANSISTDMVKDLNKRMQEAQKKAQEAAAAANTATKGATGADKTIDLSTFVDTKKKPNPITPAEAASMIGSIQPSLGGIANSMIEVNKMIESDAKAYAKSNEEIRDFYLTAENRMLYKDDPLMNKSIVDIKSGINSENLPQQASIQKKLGAIRSALIAYADDQEALTVTTTSTDDLNGLAKLIAGTPRLSAYLPKEDNTDDSGRMTASLVLEPAQSSLSTIAQTTGKAAYDYLKEFGDTTKSAIKGKIRQLASVGMPDVPTGMEGSAAEKAAIGLFIIDPVTKISERVINYTDESDKPSKILLTDVNRDGAEDLIYSYGGNIYFKENRKPKSPVPADFQPTYVGDRPAEKELTDFIPRAPAVNGVAVNYNNNKFVEMSWKASQDDDIAGYQIEYMKAPDAFDQYLNVKLHRVGIIADGNDTEEPVPDEATFRPENIRIPYKTAENVLGEVKFSGAKHTVLKPDSQNQLLKPGDLIHTLTPSELTFVLNDEDAGNIILKANRLFSVPTQYIDGIYMKVKSGSAELIIPGTQKDDQKLEDGMLIDYGDLITPADNSFLFLRFGDGSYTFAFGGQDLTLKPLESKESPSAQFTVANGFYYAKVYSFDKVGFRSTVSDTVLMSPSVCGDKELPVPIGGAAARDVSIFKKLTIDASRSFDANGDIKGFWLDTDLATDSDNNGDSTDDRNMGADLDPLTDSNGDGIIYNDLDNPVFTLGPYEDLQQRKVMLNILDESNNPAQQEITINIFVPKITLAQTTATEGVIRGSIDPQESDIPISLMRDRDGVVTKIRTPKSKPLGKYYTDEKGSFAVEDLALDDTVIIRNSKGEAIATINPETGKIVITNPNYHTEVLAAEEPLLPTRIVIKDKDGNIVLTSFLIPDANTDATVDDPNTPYDKKNTDYFKGTHLKDSDPMDEFTFEKLPADDPNYPGGAEILNSKWSGADFDIEGSPIKIANAQDIGAVSQTNKVMAVIDSGGNIYSKDPRLSLRMKEGNVDAPTVIEILIKQADGKQKVIGEMNIAVHNNKDIQFLPVSDFRPYVDNVIPVAPVMNTDEKGILTQEVAAPVPYKTKNEAVPFADVNTDNPYYKSIVKLYERGILTGKTSGNVINFGTNDAITRAEFAKIMLDIFCIIPRKEAYDAPAIFSDILYKPDRPDWFYAIVKEAYLQGFITGYTGETDKSTGLPPFKPDNTITRAEAVKVILEALERNKVIDLSPVAQSIPWFASYMRVSLNLKPYMINNAPLKEAFIVTPEEARYPGKLITRGEFVAMSDRVLTVFDCGTIDSDKDGMPDYWEKRYGLNPYDPKDADQDPDKDGLTNLNEFKHKTDPQNPDTDGDGLTDFQEVGKYNTNPNKADTDNGGINDGREVLIDKTDPNNPKDDYTKDTDGDGLTDYEETNIYHTNPTKADTDGDGLSDGDEVFKYKTDPTKSDTDGDGLTDGAEVIKYKTDPNKPDTDGDGLSDGEEISKYLTDPNKADTDDGGINDGREILVDKTNPKDSKDDNTKDTDGDGLTDYEEINIYHTDPTNPDTDGDGLTDGAEIFKYKTDPNKADTDGDGLTDGEEVSQYKTDPNKADTDGDKLSDGEEVKKYATDPLKSDTDGDGLTDGVEVGVDTIVATKSDNGNKKTDKYITDPNKPDTDGDKLSDGDEELIYWTDPTLPDTDKGGVDDGTEVKRGTDPLNPDDDVKADPRKILGEGVYAILEECLSCPCPAAVDHSADIIPKDEIFGLISNNDDTKIFNESNKIKLEQIPKK